MNHLALYQLSTNYLLALDFMTNPETDLPAEVINDTLEALGGELEDKAVNVAKFLRNMEAMAEQIKNAEAEMSKRRKSLENRAQWLKDYIKLNMEATGINKIECPYFALSLAKNPPLVNITNEDEIPEQFKTQVISCKVDKTAIKDAIKAGVSVPGATITNGLRLVIK